MSDKRDDLIGLAESLVKYSVKQGADEVEVSINQGTEFSVDVRKGEIEKLVEAGSKGLAIRIIKDKRIANSYGSSFGNYSGETFLVNSFGFSGSYQRTSCSLGVYLQAGEGDHKVEDGCYESDHYFSKLWSPEQIANKALHRVTRLIGARKVATQNVPVVLEPGMTRSILSFLYQCVNGNAIYMKQSFLLDKIGEQVANQNIMIIDDGLRPGCPGTKPFDGEGVPIRKNIVIDQGVLKTYLMDTYSARKLKMKSTGNASGPNNFYLEKGSHSPEEIIKSVDNGLLLTMGQGTNPVTGDFSRGAFGLWLEKGKIAYPVSEITISGNLAQMLNDIDMIGNDLRFDGSISGPTVRIKEMTVAGL